MSDDDDDMGDIFRALKQRSQEKRAMNRTDSAVLLAEAGIPYTSHNLGAHLIVSPVGSGMTVDFWPGTGLWRVRGFNTESRGVAKLIKFCSSKVAR